MNKTNRGVLFILIKRLFFSVIVLFLSISFLFILLRISPGDPLQKFISPELSPQLAEKVRTTFHLDGTILEQYSNFLSSLAKLDFGISYQYREPVFSVIMDYLPFTLVLMCISFIVQLLLSFSSLFIIKNRFGGKADKALGNFTLALYSTPSFVIAVILIYIFSLKLNLFPAADLRSFDFNDLSFAGKIADYFRHLTLPVLTLSVTGSVIFFKYLRDNLESLYSKTFITYLRSIGMKEKEIFKRHILPNAAGPFISVAGIEVGLLLGGALITEAIFSLPGMGRLTISAILMRDYPLVIGCSLMSGILMLLTNFISDMIRALIDKQTVAEILS